MAKSDFDVPTEVIVELSEKVVIHVLHVDNDITFLKIAKECLELQGQFQVETATSVEEAFDKMKKRTFDVIVSDYQMPRKDGREFLKELREQGNIIPFIMFTGKGREEVVIEAFNCGADGYLNKSEDSETVYCELAHSIHEAVKRKRAEGELRKSEKRFRDIAENALEWIWEVDADGKYTYANPVVEKILGYKPREVLGRYFYDFFHPEDREELKRAASEVFAKKQPFHGFASRNIDKEGKVVWLSTSGVPVVDEQGNFLGYRGADIDITQYKQAEEELNESRKHFETLFDIMVDPVAIVERSGKILQVTRKVEEVTGFKKEELVGKNFLRLKIATTKAKAIMLQNLLKRMMGMKIAPYEIEILRKDGEKIPFEINAARIEYKGKPADLVVFRDVSERRNAALALKESEEKYRNLFENASDAILVLDPEGKIMSCNKLVSVYGYDQNGLIGKTMFSFVSKKYWPLMGKHRMDALQGKTVQGEIEVDTKKGKVFAEYRANPITRGGEIVGIQMILRDITERKTREASIQESKQKFEGLFVGNPEAAVYVNPEFRISNINPRFTEIFGYTLDDVEGKTLVETILPQNKVDEGKMLDEKAKEGYVYHHDTVRKRKDGSLVEVSISAAPVSVDGEQKGYVGIYKDISELKSAERAMKQMMEKVALVNEKLRVVGRLTRHDVRNKLVAVTGNVFLAKKRLPEENEALEHLNEIDAAVKSVERIFEFAKTYEMLGIEELAYIDVEKIFGEAISLFTDLRKVKVTNDCDGLTVLADSMLRQLFYNLIDNSFRYGEKIARIRVHYNVLGGDQVNLIYEDDGVGIPDEMRQHLFKEGYGRGTGYGLYMIKRTCEVYGWSIQETGKQGRGAQFTITIPRLNIQGKENYRIR